MRQGRADAQVARRVLARGTPRAGSCAVEQEAAVRVRTGAGAIAQRSRFALQPKAVEEA